jgi:hypothetical protein
MVEAERVGLCAVCRHCQRVEGARTVFYLCTRSLTDPRFQKYPPLPVLSCAGYDPTGANTGVGESNPEPD